jgi:hypothetical protein
MSLIVLKMRAGAIAVASVGTHAAMTSWTTHDLAGMWTLERH